MVDRSFFSRAYGSSLTESGATLCSDKETGFTLIEILFVTILIGILAAISIPSYMRWVERPKYAHAKTQMNCTSKDLQIFKLEKGYYPTDTWTNAKPKGINCFYLKSSQEIPFNSLYDYENWSAPGGKCYIQISFYGKDGIRQSPNSYQSQYANPGFYEETSGLGDDVILSMGIQDCN